MTSWPARFGSRSVRTPCTCKPLGFRPRAWHFVADGTFPVRIRVHLIGGPDMAPNPPDVRSVPAEP